MRSAKDILNERFGGRHLIIRGAGPSAKLTREYKRADPEAALWTLNHHFEPTVPSDAHWEIHSPRHHDTPYGLKCPVFIHPSEHPRKNTPEVTLPVVPPNVASTIAWMLAYATMIRPTVRSVSLAGVDYLVTGRAHEIPSLNYWIGFLRGMGVQVRLPAGSLIATTEAYR